jgi:DNA-binding LacI/PurR family transcriptional regulator
VPPAPAAPRVCAHPTGTITRVAAEALNHEPSLVARSLALGRTGTVSLVAWDRLWALVNGERSGHNVHVQPRLVVRDSTGRSSVQGIDPPAGA